MRNRSPWPLAIVLGVALGTGGAALAGLAALQMQLTAGAVAQEVLLWATLLGGGIGVVIGVVLAVAAWLCLSPSSRARHQSGTVPRA